MVLYIDKHIKTDKTAEKEVLTHTTSKLHPSRVFGLEYKEP